MSETQVVNLDHGNSIPMQQSATVPEGSSCNLNGRDTQQQQLSSPGIEQQQQHWLTRSLISVGSSVCRICHLNTTKEPLISPCRTMCVLLPVNLTTIIVSLFGLVQRHLIHEDLTRIPSNVLLLVSCVYGISCKGTLAYVHLSCLERWLNQSCRTYCELCRYYFNAVETPRYRWPESLRIWISHPRNRRNIQSDLLILTLLTIVTVGLTTVCLLGMRYFIIEGKKIGISKLWTRGAIWFFLTIVILGYVTTVYLLGRDQVSPWYRWWKSTVNVRLVVDPQLLRPRRPSDTSTGQDYEGQTMAMSVVDPSRET